MESGLKRLLFLWFVSLALELGLLVFLDIPWIITVFFPLAYVILLLALLITIHSQHDWLNPLALVILIGFVRFSIPGILVFFIQPDIPVFQMMRLQKEDWILGHALALIGLLSLVIGWFLAEVMNDTTFQRVSKWSTADLSRGIPWAALLGMLLGSIALLAFVGGNTPVLDAIRTGDFRGTRIQSGTGKYFYFSLLLIASSVVFSAYLVRVKHTWRIALLPVIVAAAAFWVLGGRARSFTPLAAGLLVVWSQRDNSRISLRAVLSFVLITALAIMGFYAGALYRQGTQAEDIVQFSLLGLLDYISEAVWTDLGQLHALAAAVAIGPSVLGGRTFLLLLWPASAILDLSARSAGIFIVETLLMFGDRRWGFHATLIGDAYLNFGQIGVFITVTIFGMVLNRLYIRFRKGVINSAFYAISIVYGIRIFFESIEKFGEMLVVLFFALLIIKFGHVLTQISSAKRAWRLSPALDFVQTSMRNRSLKMLYNVEENHENISTE
jgi:hypothetical protein